MTYPESISHGLIYAIPTLQWLLWGRGDSCQTGKVIQVNRCLAWTGLCLIVAGSSGCSPGSLAKGAIKQVRGAHSKAMEVPGTLSGSLGEYKSVNVSPVRTELGGLVPGKFSSVLPGAMREYLSEGKGAPFPGGSPALTIDTQIQWFHKAGALREMFGSESYAVVLYRLTSGGAEKGRVQVVTKEAAAHTDEDDMAKSSAKELADWLEKKMKK